jgi:hypothetical protein
MKTNSVLSFLTLTALAAARPVPGNHKIEPRDHKIEPREVPQEHSHEQFIVAVRKSLNIDNPAGIGDPVFGLLGNVVRLCSLHLLSWPISRHHLAQISHN